MEIRIFGRQQCPNCKIARKTVVEFLVESGVECDVPTTYFDMDTIDGRAEGAYYDVRAIPTTILSEGNQDIARWDGTIPSKEELSTKIKGHKCCRP